jgi:hypothetical protein
MLIDEQMLSEPDGIARKRIDPLGSLVATATLPICEAEIELRACSGFREISV